MLKGFLTSGKISNAQQVKDQDRALWSDADDQFGQNQGSSTSKTEPALRTGQESTPISINATTDSSSFTTPVSHTSSCPPSSMSSVAPSSGPLTKHNIFLTPVLSLDASSLYTFIDSNVDAFNTKISSYLQAPSTRAGDPVVIDALGQLHSSLIDKWKSVSRINFTSKGDGSYPSSSSSQPSLYSQRLQALLSTPSTSTLATDLGYINCLGIELLTLIDHLVHQQQQQHKQTTIDLSCPIASAPPSSLISPPHSNNNTLHNKTIHDMSSLPSQSPSAPLSLSPSLVHPSIDASTAVTPAPTNTSTSSSSSTSTPTSSSSSSSSLILPVLSFSNLQCMAPKCKLTLSLTTTGLLLTLPPLSVVGTKASSNADLTDTMNTSTSILPENDCLIPYNDVRHIICVPDASSSSSSTSPSSYHLIIVVSPSIAPGVGKTKYPLIHIKVPSLSSTCTVHRVNNDNTISTNMTNDDGFGSGGSTTNTPITIPKSLGINPTVTAWDYTSSTYCNDQSSSLKRLYHIFSTSFPSIFPLLSPTSQSSSSSSFPLSLPLPLHDFISEALCISSSSPLLPLPSSLTSRLPHYPHQLMMTDNESAPPTSSSSSPSSTSTASSKHSIVDTVPRPKLSVERGGPMLFVSSSAALTSHSAASTFSASYLRCYHKANEGVLYPLKSGILFVGKPLIYINLLHITATSANTGGTRTYDLQLTLGHNTNINIYHNASGNNDDICYSIYNNMLFRSLSVYGNVTPSTSASTSSNAGAGTSPGWNGLLQTEYPTSPPSIGSSDSGSGSGSAPGVGKKVKPIVVEFSMIEKEEKTNLDIYLMKLSKAKSKLEGSLGLSGEWNKIQQQKQQEDELTQRIAKDNILGKRRESERNIDDSSKIYENEDVKDSNNNEPKSKRIKVETTSSETGQGDKVSVERDEGKRDEGNGDKTTRSSGRRTRSSRGGDNDGDDGLVEGLPDEYEGEEEELLTDDEDEDEDEDEDAIDEDEDDVGEAEEEEGGESTNKKDEGNNQRPSASQVESENKTRRSSRLRDQEAKGVVLRGRYTSDAFDDDDDDDDDDDEFGSDDSLEDEEGDEGQNGDGEEDDEEEGGTDAEGEGEESDAGSMHDDDDDDGDRRRQIQPKKQVRPPIQNKRSSKSSQASNLLESKKTSAAPNTDLSTNTTTNQATTTYTTNANALNTNASHNLKPGATLSGQPISRPGAMLQRGGFVFNTNNK